MNLCSVSILLCLIIGAGGGFVGGNRHGAVGGVLGIALGLMIAGGIIYAMVALERMASRSQGRKAVMPFAVFAVVASAAPLASGVLSVALANVICGNLDSREYYFSWTGAAVLGLAGIAVAWFGEMARRTLLISATGALPCAVLGVCVVAESSWFNPSWDLGFGVLLLLLAAATPVILWVRQRAWLRSLETASEPEEAEP